LIDTDFSNYFTEPKKAEEGYQQVFEKGFVADYPLTIKHKNGNLTDVLYNASVYKDDKGNVLGVFAAARDVTEQKWAIDLRIANKELVVQNEEKEKRAEELVILVKELESFNYISSHDLQEPLRQIQIFSSRISDGEVKHLSDAGKTYFEKINNAAKRMQNLINDLLAYSRTKTEARKFKIINLNEIINEVKEEFEEIISDKHATVEVAELGVAYVITFQFRQLMHNLIGNALKFSRPDTPPHITIKNEKVKSNQVPDVDQIAETEYYHISITDNGIGFEQQYKDRMFEVFQRLHDKEKIAGTGIGLAIVKNIVENHNGIITATGELNKGATFDIYIPTIQKL
jgi:light-regulated signal transduction histidine kinase (bacteriophytochrome)